MRKRVWEWTFKGVGVEAQLAQLLKVRELVGESTAQLEAR